MNAKVYFSDFFDVREDVLEQYGAFNISLYSDLPLFIDPFLLFHSKKPEYQKLHENIITYLKFLRDKAVQGKVDKGLLHSWYIFSEVKQNWLGYSIGSNKGSGLGQDFAHSLRSNLHTLFSNFGNQKITKSEHLEKLCLVKDGVGRDNISDFTTNLIKEFLLEYTQTFARNHIAPELIKNFAVKKVRFNYSTERWESGNYDLPFWRISDNKDDYVLLTPKDILSKDDIWINKTDLSNKLNDVIDSIPNFQLRAEINNYFFSMLDTDTPTNKKRKRAGPSKETIKAAKIAVLRKYYEALLDYYILYKENNGDEAQAESGEKVSETEQFFIKQVKRLIENLANNTNFYQLEEKDTLETARSRVLKQVIENNDGYRIFYQKGKQIKRESDLQILYVLTWYATSLDVNREVNNGRGPVDFKISKGRLDKTLVEFKLASNTQLEKNLQNQLKVYEKANTTENSLNVILYFSKTELDKVNNILKNLKRESDPNIILIDARADNKPSASVARTSEG